MKLNDMKQGKKITNLTKKSFANAFSRRLTSSAFALPTLVITATILMIAGASMAQATVSVSSSIRSQNWQHIADEAARAGISYATSCLKKNGTSYWTNPLKPSTNCSGSSNGGSAYLKDQAASGDTPHWRSSFSVSVPSNGQATSEGKMELLDTGGTVTKSWVSDKNLVINLTGSSASGVTQISAGYSHTCAVIKSKAYCWGQNNYYGELGNNSTAQSLVPVAVNTSGVLNGKTVTSIDTGSAHSCAVADAAAYCWGNNTYGHLGNNSTTYSLVPVATYTGGALSGKTVTGITGSFYGACAIASGAAYCWGGNSYGQLGNNSTTQSLVPVAVYTGGVLSGKAVTSIDGRASLYHVCAIADGKAYCWGRNNYGQLGNNSTTDSSIPVAVYASGVLSGKTVTDISVGDQYSCAVANGAAYCWGQNTSGSLGNNSTTTSYVPVAVYTGGALSGKTVTAVSAGLSHSCAVANGAAYCWGANNYGQLGNGSTTASSVPVAVNTSGVLNGKTVTAISAGQTHTCAIADSKAYCWGYNQYGKLGNNSTTNSSVPVLVTSP